MQRLRAANGREAEPREVAEALGISLDEYYAALEAVISGWTLRMANELTLCEWSR